MIRRPKAGDTEQDLLAFQERFLASRGSPSASIVGGSKAGDKRPIARTVDRDVVRLRTSGTQTGSGSMQPLNNVILVICSLRRYCFVPTGRGPSTVQKIQVQREKRSS